MIEQYLPQTNKSATTSISETKQGLRLRRSRKRPAGPGASASPRGKALRSRYIKVARGSTEQASTSPAADQLRRPIPGFRGERSGDVEGPRGAAPGQDGVQDAGGVGAARAVLDGMART